MTRSLDCQRGHRTGGRVSLPRNAHGIRADSGAKRTISAFQLAISEAGPTSRLGARARYSPCSSRSEATSTPGSSCRGPCHRPNRPLAASASGQSAASESPPADMGGGWRSGPRAPAPRPSGVGKAAESVGQPRAGGQARPLADRMGRVRLSALVEAGAGHQTHGREEIQPSERTSFSAFFQCASACFSFSLSTSTHRPRRGTDAHFRHPGGRPAPPRWRG